MMKTELRQYLRRYQELVRVMKKLSPHQKRRHFAMDDWMRITECGTSHCAAGYAGRDAWFKRRGFTMVDDPVLAGVSSDAAPGPAYEGDFGWEAIESFFGALPGDGFEINEPERFHPVFARPRTVRQVIAAAEKRIKILQLLSQ